MRVLDQPCIDPLARNRQAGTVGQRHRPFRPADEQERRGQINGHRQSAFCPFQINRAEVVFAIPAEPTGRKRFPFRMRDYEGVIAKGNICPLIAGFPSSVVVAPTGCPCSVITKSSRVFSIKRWCV